MGLISTMMESIGVLKRPTIGRDLRQGVTQTYATIAENLPCSAQESRASVKDLYAQRNVLVGVTVYFSQDPGAMVNDLLVSTNQRTGEVLTLLVQGTAQPVSRGRLWTVDAERIRQPA